MVCYYKSFFSRLIIFTKVRRIVRVGLFYSQLVEAKEVTASPTDQVFAQFGHPFLPFWHLCVVRALPICQEPKVIYPILTSCRGNAGICK